VGQDPIAELLDAIDKYIEAKHAELSGAAEFKDSRNKASKIRRANLEMALRYVLPNTRRGSSSMRFEAIRIDKDPDDSDDEKTGEKK